VTGYFYRLQPYKQMSLKQAKKDNKLSPKYYGPYKVLQKIGTMAYKLELPASSRVHPVFHVSCLKKVIGDKLPVQTIYFTLDGEGGFDPMDEMKWCKTSGSFDCRAIQPRPVHWTEGSMGRKTHGRSLTLRRVLTKISFSKCLP
jgi:hypothetical protein